MAELLTRAALLAAASPQHKDVAVPDLGTVRVAQLTIAEKKAWAAVVNTLPKEQEHLAVPLLVVHGLRNADGTRLFTDDDIDAVSALKPDVVDALYREISSHNGLDRLALETAEKN